MWKYNYTDELYHHGILGMKWGIRRYQNKDGSLTDKGKQRYNKNEKSIYVDEYGKWLNEAGAIVNDKVGNVGIILTTALLATSLATYKLSEIYEDKGDDVKAGKLKTAAAIQSIGMFAAIGLTGIANKTALKRAENKERREMEKSAKIEKDKKEAARKAELDKQLMSEGERLINKNKKLKDGFGRNI